MKIRNSNFKNNIKFYFIDVFWNQKWYYFLIKKSVKKYIIIEKHILKEENLRLFDIVNI
jgi:hypothetical protein